MLIAVGLCALAMQVVQAQSSMPQAALTDPLEYVYDDTQIAEATKLAEFDAPANGIVDVNILLNGFATNRPVTVMASVPGGEWFALQAVPCGRNSGKDGFSEKKIGSNPYVARRAPFKVCDVLRPLAKGELASPGKVAALRWKLALKDSAPASAPQLRGDGALAVASPKELRVVFTVRQDKTAIELPLVVRIHAARLPAVGKDSFKYTNWINFNNIAVSHKLTLWSEEYWAMVEKYVKMATGARQNMSWMPGVDCLREENEARFARLLDIYNRAGVWYLEGPQLAGFNGGWGAKNFLVSGTKIVTTTPEGMEKMAALARRTKTLVDKYDLSQRWFQHVADEPGWQNVGEYRKTVAVVRRELPNVQYTEPVETADFNDILDFPCPKVDLYEHQRDKFLKSKGAWTYVCCRPGGKWLNRFMDQELVKPALLPWVSVLFDVDGFLHWGYNMWRQDQDPFLEPYPKHWGGANGGNTLPPGDTHIVYPGTDGPWPSARLEATRSGMEDADLLRALKRRDQVAAEQLIKRLARGYADYTKDLKQYRAVRRSLLEMLSQTPGR